MALYTVTTLDDTVAADGQTSLREALALANATATADDIVFDSTLSGTVVLDNALGELTITSDVTIDGDTDGDNRADVAVDGDDQVRVFNVTAGTSTLESLTIVGGNAGAGNNGGGVQVLGGAVLTVSNTTVAGNYAISGGGIYNDGTLTLFNTTVAYNATIGTGGGVLNHGDATLTNVTLAGNSTGLGGGLYNLGTATLTNTTVSGNTASDAAGIYNQAGADLTLANSIVLGHVVPGNYAEIYSSPAATLTYAGVNIVGLGLDFDPAGGVMNAPSVEAVFAHLGANGGGILADNGGPVPTIALNPDATNPAFDVGSAARLDETLVARDLNGDGDQLDTIDTDARGFARSVGGVDLGALEQQAGASFEVTTLDDELDSVDPAVLLAAPNDLSLREALFLAQQDPTSVDDITFDSTIVGGATPADNGEIVLTQGELAVFGNVNIDGDVGGDGSGDITLRADPLNPTAVLHFYHGISSLNGVTVTGGDALYGAGISVGAYLYGGIADVTITNSLIENNVADYGGGISVDVYSSLRLVGSTVTGNNAAYIGGGIAVNEDATLTVISSAISNNHADPTLGPDGYGGGIAVNAGASVTLINSTVSGNSAYYGGGIYNGGFLTLINTTLANNSAQYGGGLYNAVPLCGCGGVASLINSTVSGNYAVDSGGGVYHADGILNIANTIVAGNGAGYGYADVFLGGPTNYLGVNVFSQVAVGTPLVDIYEANVANIFASLTTIDPDGMPGTGDEFQAGLLANNGGPVQTIAIRLGPQGVAHNAGDNGQLPQDTQDLDGDNDTTDDLPFDARGVTRVVSGIVDVGAFEIQNTNPTQAVNTGLSVDEGDSATILGTQLDFDDAEQADGDITYTITTTPANGTLFLNGNPLGPADTFTQADIGNGDVSYTHDGSETTADTLFFGVSDGQGGTANGTFAFTINPLNDTAGGVAGGTIQYIEDQAPTALDPALTVTDPDDTNLEGAQVAITGNFVAGQDVLAFTPQFGITGNYNALTGVLTLTGTALLADYETVLRSVTYFNSSQNPSNLPRTVSFQVDDGGGLAPMGTVGINVVPQLDPPNDANGDHTTDVLWRENTGTVALWEMDGVNVLANNGIATLPNHWQILDADSDFDGDGRSDILWQDNAGVVVLWTMDGPDILSNTVVGVAIPDHWLVADTGDFTGDGRGDILWRESSGRVVLWEMNGATIVSNTFVADVPLTSQIEDTADFTGDGMNDVLWRDQDGTVRIWEMDGANVVSDTVVATLPDHWHVEGTGDFNGDVRADILWRDNAGTVVLWEMDGPAIIGNTALGTLPSHWQVADLGDYTGDTNSDILWRDNAGTIVLWEMDGPTILDNSAVNTIPTTWQIVG
jgi:CSLREA domain-containing protein